jgi:hypothetical protein
MTAAALCPPFILRLELANRLWPMWPTGQTAGMQAEELATAFNPPNHARLPENKYPGQSVYTLAGRQVPCRFTC